MITISLNIKRITECLYAASALRHRGEESPRLLHRGQEEALRCTCRNTLALILMELSPWIEDTDLGQDKSEEDTVTVTFRFSPVPGALLLAELEALLAHRVTAYVYGEEYRSPSGLYELFASCHTEGTLPKLSPNY